MLQSRVIHHGGVTFCVQAVPSLATDTARQQFDAEISAAGRRLFRPSDFPITVERALLDRGINVVINPARVGTSWAKALCGTGRLEMAFRTQDDINRYYALPLVAQPLNITGVSGATPGSWVTTSAGNFLAGELGPFKIKVLFMPRTAHVEDFIRWQMMTYPPDHNWGIDPSTKRPFPPLPASAGHKVESTQGHTHNYILGFMAEEDRLWYVRHLHNTPCLLRPGHTLQLSIVWDPPEGGLLEMLSPGQPRPGQRTYGQGLQGPDVRHLPLGGPQ
jgi:hypothetical protein